MIRVAVIGVSHWHLKLYLDPLRAHADVSIVGVADTDEAVAKKLGEDLGCEWSSDYRQLCDELKPDFVMALGAHDEMAAEAEYLIEAGIPFAIEKPAGLNGTEVKRIAQLASERNAFAAVPFVFRQSDYVAKMLEGSAGERFDYLSFTMIGRPPQQYERAGCAWMLDRDRAGGGALVNLGIHFLDLVPFLLPDDEVKVTSAAVSSAAWNYSIEDFATVTLSAGSSIATVQTGYVYTSPNEYMDMHFTVRSPSAYYVVRDPHHMQMSTPGGDLKMFDVETTNIGYYPRFVDDVIDRVRSGKPPLASLTDAAAAMGLLDAIYATAGVVS
jgi:predicted dehydrogenase